MWFWTNGVLVNLVTGGVWDWLSNLENLRWMIPGRKKWWSMPHWEIYGVWWDDLWLSMMIYDDFMYVVLQMVSFRWSPVFRKKQVGFVARPAWEYTHETNHRTHKWNIYWRSACLPASGTLPELLKGIYRISCFWLCVCILLISNLYPSVSQCVGARHCVEKKSQKGPRTSWVWNYHKLPKTNSSPLTPKKWWIFQ